ncbi:hypothetical protein J6590_012295 [Homalodisca vitripennis]|nr:hypothetical protein J6590_012295 [Homalodisca vitripennis]
MEAMEAARQHTWQRGWTSLSDTLLSLTREETFPLRGIFYRITSVHELTMHEKPNRTLVVIFHRSFNIKIFFSSPKELIRKQTESALCGAGALGLTLTNPSEPGAPHSSLSYPLSARHLEFLKNQRLAAVIIQKFYSRRLDSSRLKGKNSVRVKRADVKANTKQWRDRQPPTPCHRHFGFD